MNSRTIKALAFLAAALCCLVVVIAAILVVKAVLPGTGGIKQLLMMLAGVMVYAVYTNYAACRIMDETERLLEKIENKTAS
jgi:uncharacterized RDD family membrane protein YckC